LIMRFTVGDQGFDASTTLEEFGQWPEIVEAALEAVQEAVQHDRSLGLPSNWPECPLHPGTHPMEPFADGETITWGCPNRR